MTATVKVVVAGIFLLVFSIYLFFTVRFKYIEQDYIAALVAMTNDIVRSYQMTEKRISAKKKTTPQDVLSEFLKLAHATYKDIALLAITDKGLSLRLSSKNDRFIRSADLFEEILKDFTQERFNITKNNPYIIRYYDEKTAIGVTQHKFYIFLAKIGDYRLLVVYPYHFGKKILARTGLELSLVVVFFIIITLLAGMLLSRRQAQAAGPAQKTVRENHDAGQNDDGPAAVSGSERDDMAGALPGVISDQLHAIHRLYASDCVSLYVCGSTGWMQKAAELSGNAFFKPGAVIEDTIDINNEAGIELRKSTTLVLDDGRKIIFPMIYNDVFLGTVNMFRHNQFTGNEIQEIRAGINGILKAVNDFVVSKKEINDPV